MQMTMMQQMYDFSSARVLMSGGSGVLGRALATALLAHGADVVLLTRDPARAATHFASTAGVSRLHCIAADLAIATDIQRAVAEALADGPITHLVNGAGGNRPQATTGAHPFADIPLTAMHEVMDVNVFSAIQLSQAVVPHFVTRGSGCILNISSISTQRPLTRVLTYSVAKAGLDAYTRWLATHLAREYAPEIRVNALAPGFFLTEQNRFLLLEADGTTLTPRGQQILAHTPMGRFGTPEDLVGAFLWLLSPASAFVTGQIITVDGGFTAFSGV
jgi:NAD(P)-dependent dehydrogenase (short-subunit alcohol dehydrogenase family)